MDRVVGNSVKMRLCKICRSSWRSRLSMGKGLGVGGWPAPASGLTCVNQKIMYTHFS